jgi:penicillin amidase
MNVFKRIIQGIAILLLIFIIIIVIFFSYIYYDTKPVLEGSISVENISNSVEIIRDESGIPHIFARNDIDAYFSLGYAMAQDRLWQMEYFRLMSSGRLSEVLGEEYIALDKEMRKLMIYERGKEIAELIITNNKDEQYVKCIMSNLQGEIHK